MTPHETALCLAKAQGYDNRTVGEANILAWHEVLADVPLDDALAAVTAHYGATREFIMPADIRAQIAKAKALRRERIQAAGPADFPPGLTWEQERLYRRDFQAAIGSGMSRAEAQDAVDARFRVTRPELVTRPANVPAGILGGGQ